MSHLYVLTRGQHTVVDKWKNDLAAQWVPYKMNPHEAPGSIQIGVRPIQLWEIACPKESVNSVIKTLGIGKVKAKWSDITRKLFTYALKLRAVMGLKAIPKIPKDTPMLPVAVGQMSIYGVGLKDDKEAKIELV